MKSRLTSLKYIAFLAFILMCLISPAEIYAQPYCNEAQGTAGFPSDIPCQTEICNADNYCCDTLWDSVCASAAAIAPTCCGCVEPSVSPPTAVCLSNQSFTLDAYDSFTLTASQIDNGSTSGTCISLSVSPSTFDCTNLGFNTVTLTVTDNVSGASSTCNSQVTIEPSPAEAVCDLPLAGVAYLYSSVGATPFFSTSNETDLDLAFGSGNWDQLFFESVDPTTLFSADYSFVFLEGSDDGADELEAFLGTNGTLIENWVAGGNTLFINAAPLEGDGMSFGFGGVQLNYINPGTVINDVQASDPAHPIFSGPHTPVGTSFTGNNFSHAIICPAGLNASVLLEDTNDNTRHALVEASWGLGTVFFGGMTPSQFHNPDPNAQNLRSNMFHYLQSITTFNLDVNGQLTITPEQIGPNSTLGCGTAAVSPNSFDCNDIGSQVVTLTVTDINGNTDVCTLDVTIEASPAEAVCGLPLAGVAYLYSSVAGSPWGSTSNETDLDLAFGAGNWDQLFFETVVPSTLFSSDYSFVFLDGSSSGATELEAFLGTNGTLIENWVAAGNRLFINAAPNAGDGMSYGFGGVQLVYDANYIISSVQASDPAHPIFSGPHTPVGTSFIGFGFSHAIICPAGLNATVLLEDINDNTGHALVEASWGMGTVFFGGMTVTGFHEPEPNAQNLRSNMFHYLQNSTIPTLSLDANGQVTITPEQIGPDSNLGCGSATVSPSNFDCNDVGAQVVSLTVTDINGNTDVCTLDVTIEASPAEAVCPLPLAGVAYLYSSVAGSPWNSTSNETDLDLAFGAGNWDQLFFETVVPSTLFSADYSFVFLEGSHNGADELEAFLGTNGTLIENWVVAGNSLFINAAPNEGDGMSYGFGGVQLVYNGTQDISSVEASDPSHPIFSGPQAPVGTSFSGNNFSHAIICPAGLNASVLLEDTNDNTKHALVEASWGFGKVFFGGMTPSSFHNPDPNAQNLRSNMFVYLQSIPIFSLDANGQVLITPEQIGPLSTLGCGSATVSPNSFDCDDVGPQVVTLTVTDINGNTDVCTSDVMVTNPNSVTAVCVQTTKIFIPTFQLDANGEFLLDGALIDGGSTTNCPSISIVSTTASPNLFNCTDVGYNQVTLTVTDSEGNIDECVTAILIEDNNPIVVIDCPEDISITIPDALNCPGVVYNYNVTVQSSACHIGGSPVLLDVLNNFNSSTATINAVIPNQYEFTDGVSGSSIDDGGGDMYDTGNILNTDLASSIPYSDNSIMMHAGFGATGSYFTAKTTGALFLMAADLDGVSSFFISGELGADGGGTADGVVLTQTVSGKTFKGFVKRVCDAGDPSVNHLIMVEDNASAAQTFASNTNDDQHDLTGLSTSTRVYYLLFAGDSGYCYSDTEITTIMTTFLNEIGEAEPNAEPVVEQTFGPASGEIFAEGANYVEHTITDYLGNVTYCEFTVTVEDPNDLCTPPLACDNTIPIVCGEALQGSNIGVFQETSYLAYADNDNYFSYVQYYEYFANSNGTVDILMSNLEDDLDLLFLTNGTSCDEIFVVSSGTPGLSDESIIGMPVVAGETYIINARGWYRAQSTFTLTLSCNPDYCDTDLHYKSPNDDYADYRYQATDQSIYASNKIEENGVVAYSAGTSTGEAINLEIGFEVEVGAIFDAFLEGCLATPANQSPNDPASIMNDNGTAGENLNQKKESLGQSQKSKGRISKGKLLLENK